MKMKLNKKQLKKIKVVELDILKEIDRICKKNGINYSIFWGTLIGQCRHNGFIPWDDDIDIVMTIDQYDRFIDCLPYNLNEKLFYSVDYKKYKDYGLPFIKIMAKNTIMKEVSISNNSSPCGIFVDVIPIYPTSNDLTERDNQCKIASKIYLKLLCKCNYTLSNKLLGKIYYGIKRIFIFKSKKKLICEFEKNARKYVDSDFDNYVALCLTSTIDKGIFPKKYFDEYVNVKFENLDVKSIKNSDSVLKITYGNYMKLPPVEDRVAHHFIEQLNYDDFFKLKKNVRGTNEKNQGR